MKVVNYNFEFFVSLRWLENLTLLKNKSLIRSFFLLSLVVLAWACTNKGTSDEELVEIDTIGVEVPNIVKDTAIIASPLVPMDYYTYQVPKVDGAPRNIHAEDSIWVSNYNLIFKPIDEVSISAYYPDQAIRDSITRKFPIELLKALAVEKYLLKARRSSFSRHKDTLKLHLNNGRVLALVDQSDRLVYHYENDFAEVDFHLIRVQFGDGSGYLMVNKNNGTVYNLWGRPYFSPSKNIFLTIHSDLEEQISPNGIQLFSLNHGGIKKLWELAIRDWGPTKAQWVAENTLQLETASIIDSESDVVITTDFQQLVLKEP